MLKFYKKRDNGWPAKGLPPKTHYYILWPNGILQHMCWHDWDGWHTPDGIAISGVGSSPPWGGEVDAIQVAAAIAAAANEGPVIHLDICPTGDDLTGGILGDQPYGT